jgi:hypothetical protein
MQAVSGRTYAKSSQQGAPSQTVAMYGKAVQRRWGGFVQVLLAKLLMVGYGTWLNNKNNYIATY